MVARVIQFPAPDARCREDDASYLYSRLRWSFFEVVSEKWSLEDQHRLRLTLQSVPHLLKGDLLVQRNALDDVYSAEDARDLEVAFRTFALEHGLLNKAFFREPGNTILQVPQRGGPRWQRLELA